jgi:CBS domain containing-hemolysin-like protein
MSGSWQSLAPAVLLVVAGLAAVQARAARGAQRPLLQELCERRRRPERYGEIVAASETIAFVAASVVAVAAVAATLLAFQGIDVPVAGMPAVVGWIVLVWVVLVVVPMLLVRLAGPWIVVVTWTLWRPVVGVIAPVVGLLGRMAATLSRICGSRAERGPEGPHDELRAVVDDAHREGRLEGEARDMIRGVIGLDEVRVAAVMTPRTSIVAIPAAASWEEAVRLAAESGHTRLPVWGRSPDDVVGILHIRDVFGLFAAGFAPDTAPPALRQLLRPPWFVPESMNVGKLLREFRRGNTHLAIVTDEYGGVAGLVTIEDALEEIVGEIADEHDEAFTDGIRPLAPDACEVLAYTRVETINRQLGCRLPEEEDFDTIGGFVFHQFGRIPEVGERLETHGVRIEVLAATRRRIDLVRIDRLEPVTDEPAARAGHDDDR